MYGKFKKIGSLSLIAVCLFWVAAANAQGGMVSLRPVDTGRSVVFRIDRGAGTFDRLSLKTNLLYAATLTPNLALEVGLGRKITLEVSAGYNGWGNFWDFGTDPNVATRQLDHILGKAEGRWWFRERFDGHFLGVHALYADYKINGMEVPLLFEKDYRYNGNAVGAGLSWGYVLRWSDRFGVEFNFGVGVVSMRYDKYLCTTDCSGGAEVYNYRKTYFGPTSVGVKLFFMLK